MKGERSQGVDFTNNSFAQANAVSVSVLGIQLLLFLSATALPTPWPKQ